MKELTRRQFTGALAALGLNQAAAQSAASVHAELLPLSRNGWMPNNELLPVLLYRRAFTVSGDAASRMEQRFTTNLWPPQWRNGVYAFHHYHSTAHEVLGFAAGSAHLVLGGENGHDLTVNAGDVVVLPAGTGHCRITATPDCLVIGASPREQHWDICRAAPDAAAAQRMRALPFPASDPVGGPAGPLVRHWTAGAV